MHHEVSSQSPGSEVVHTAGPICHISHHQSVRFCESDKTTQSTNQRPRSPPYSNYDQSSHKWNEGSTQSADQSLKSGNVTQMAMSLVKWAPANCKSQIAAARMRVDALCVACDNIWNNLQRWRSTLYTTINVNICHKWTLWFLLTWLVWNFTIRLLLLKVELRSSIDRNAI